MSYKLSNEEWAYVAGIIDSDGCIQAPYLSKKTTKNRFRHHRIELHIIQRDLPLIEFLYERFQGSVNLVSTKHKSGRHYYMRFMITGPRCAEILSNCLPYLRLKRQQAILAVKLQEIILPKGNAKKLSDELFQKRTSLAKRIKLLNSPATTERVGSLTKEMRQSELAEMKNRQRVT